MTPTIAAAAVWPSGRVQVGRAVEISPAYCAVALQRWADHTQRTPVLLEA